MLRKSKNGQGGAGKKPGGSSERTSLLGGSGQGLERQGPWVKAVKAPSKHVWYSPGVGQAHSSSVRCGQAWLRA